MQVAQIVDFHVEVERVETAVSVGEVQVDDIRSLRPQYSGHLAKRTGDITKDDAQPRGAAVGQVAPRKV